MTKQPKQGTLPAVDERPAKPLSGVLREFGERLAKAGQQAALIEAAAASGVGYAQVEQIARVQAWVDTTRGNMTSLETYLNAFAYQLNVNREREADRRAACAVVAQAMRELLASKPDATAADLAATCAALEREGGA